MTGSQGEGIDFQSQVRKQLALTTELDWTLNLEKQEKKKDIPREVRSTGGRKDSNATAATVLSRIISLRRLWG